VKIFLSYGHDKNTPIALRIKKDLEANGHSVWIDTSEIKNGEDWRRSIIDGLSDSDWTLGLLSQHSVRNPGVCLDELAIALHVKGGTIATVLVEAEAAAAPPISVSHIQWLDMHDWAERLADNSDDGEKWYRSKVDEILTLLAHPATQRFAGEIKNLARRLQPISQEADIGTLVDGFIGREWLKSKLQDWRRNARDSRLFWISGAPGTGKSAFAAWLAHRGDVNVIGLNLCRYNIDERRDPARVLRTIAFQIATRLPDYRRLLSDRLQHYGPDGAALDRQSVPALFDLLLAEPLRLTIDGGRSGERYLVVIDALDETIRDGRSALAEVLAESCQKLPNWIAVVVTGRPEPAILRQFAGFKPQTIEAESAENLDDLRTFARRWLGIESRGAGDTAARVERMVAASQGNFLYLRKLTEAATAGLVDLDHPDGLPQGLIGLYERWFRRQFPNAAEFEAYRPFFEVLVAAEHPVPEIWWQRIIGWSKRDVAKMFEQVGSLVERRVDGILPFHKSLRDWLVDDRNAGADFAIEAEAGAARLTTALRSAFESWTNERENVVLDPFCEAELLSQLTRPKSDPGRLRDFARLLGDPDVIRRRMQINTNADEDARRTARHYYRGLFERVSRIWPADSNAEALWTVVRGLTACAWPLLDDHYGPGGTIAWEDIQPVQLAPQMQEVTRRYNEWKEAMLLLVTALDIALTVVTSRSELIPKLAEVMTPKLRDFISTDAGGLARQLHSSTMGREYFADRNLSFIRNSAKNIYQSFGSDPRLSGAMDGWSKIL
jgi:TIR domain